MPPLSVGVALRAGLPVWELKAKQADLEELFFSLTGVGDEVEIVH